MRKLSRIRTVIEAETRVREFDANACSDRILSEVLARVRPYAGCAEPRVARRAAKAVAAITERLQRAEAEWASAGR